MLLEITKSKKGTALVIIDPRKDTHVCVDAEELLETVHALLEDDTMPSETYQPAPPPGPAPSSNGEDNDVNLGQLLSDPIAQKMASQGLDFLRKISHKGSKKPPPEEAKKAE